MKTVRMKIADLVEDPANLRKHGERNLRSIRSSLARFGQQKPVVIDKDNVVRAGSGTLEAARSLGWDSIDVVRTDLKGSEATAFSIADNRTAELAGWDEVALAESLRALQSEDFDLEAVGYTAEELDGLVEKLTREHAGSGESRGLAGDVVDDPAGEWEGMPEFNHEDLTSFQAIHVHFKSREDVEDFAKLIGQKITENTKSIWHPKQEIIRYGESE